MSDFRLDPKLEADLVFLGEFELCQARLLPSQYNPWIVLIPKKAGITEWHQLSSKDQSQMFDELSRVSSAMEELFQPTTLNVGALGNIVRQFHLHVISRFDSDPAWPGPVWGTDLGDSSKVLEKNKVLFQQTLFS